MLAAKLSAAKLSCGCCCCCCRRGPRSALRPGRGLRGWPRLLHLQRRQTREGGEGGEMLRNLPGSVPEVPHRETGGGRWTGEDVMGGLRSGAAFGTQVGVRDADGVPVGVEAGAVAGPQLGQGGTVVAGEGGLIGDMLGAGRCRTLFTLRLARWAATVAVWMSLMVERWLAGLAVPSSSRNSAILGRKADWRSGILGLGPGSWVTRARDGWEGRSAPARNCEQSMERWSDKGRTSDSEWRCWMSDLSTEPVAIRRAWFWIL